MNSLNGGHRLAELIARRKAGLMGEFNYVCFRTGRGEILELVKEKDKEGWERLNNIGGESMVDSEFEAKVRKLVSKLPWEKEVYKPLFNVKTEMDNDRAVVKIETKEEIKEEFKEEFKEEPEEEYAEFKEGYIEEYKYKEEYKEKFKVEIKVEADDLERESDFRNIVVGKKEEDIVDGKSLDADINAGMNFRFACQKELSEKSFDKVKTSGSVWNRVGKKKDLPHVKTDARPCEEELVKAVKDYYASLQNQDMRTRKHVLAHLQKLYGIGDFRKFGFGTLKNFTKKHDLDDQKLRRKITTKIQETIRKVRTPRGHYFCDPCGVDDLNVEEAREHIENCHSAIYSQVSQQRGYWGRGQTCTNDIIEDILRNSREVDNNAKDDIFILSRLSAMFFRSGNIYHCIICDNRPIGKEEHHAMKHLSMCHVREEMAMKEFIQLKYDEHVDKNFKKCLRLGLHKVESF